MMESQSTNLTVTTWGSVWHGKLCTCWLFLSLLQLFPRTSGTSMHLLPQVSSREWVQGWSLGTMNQTQGDSGSWLFSACLFPAPPGSWKSPSCHSLEQFSAWRMTPSPQFADEKTEVQRERSLLAGTGKTSGIGMGPGARQGGVTLALAPFALSITCPSTPPSNEHKEPSAFPTQAAPKHP
jgi:hypothetical protein